MGIMNHDQTSGAEGFSIPGGQEADAQDRPGMAPAPGVTRRRFMQLTGAGLAWLGMAARSRAAGGYKVGVGRSTDPYTATLRAVEASTEWPADRITGRTVAIKPNLVTSGNSATGQTTDPQVVRALVDLALAAGAVKVLIVESGATTANFSPCGYDFFTAYAGAGKVSLVNLGGESVSSTFVPTGLAYGSLYMPTLLLADDVVFISAAKLKCHNEAVATLAMKNLVGLLPIEKYEDPETWLTWRYVMHKRGLHQAIVDMNLVRPIDFAVVDGIWGMEGNGPIFGTPVRMDTVVAGRNATAVDRVCLKAMGISQRDVRYLEYAARIGLGPVEIDEIEMRGDLLKIHTFVQPGLPPMLECPTAIPNFFVAGTNQTAQISYWVQDPCWARVEIVRTSDASPDETVVRTLYDWTKIPAGIQNVAWNGLDDHGQVTASGLYTIRVHVAAQIGSRDTYATGWVRVVQHQVHMPVIMANEEG